MENVNFNYIDILNSELELRSSRNAHYSLRAFARDLDINASRLSEILNRKKGISENAALELVKKLNLSEKEKEFFILSATSQHSRSKRLKDEATLDLSKKLKAKKSTQKLDPKEFELAQNWYHFAIMELTELTDCEQTIEWFAKKLKLKNIVIKGALARLMKIGWLNFDGEKYVTRDLESETTYDIPSTSLKKYHEEILLKANQSLFTDDVQDREFLNMTLAFPSEEMEEAKAAIREFQKQFAERFYGEGKEKNSVYQLSVQLFRLDTKLH